MLSPNCWSVCKRIMQKIGTLLIYIYLHLWFLNERDLCSLFRMVIKSEYNVDTGDIESRRRKSQVKNGTRALPKQCHTICSQISNVGSTLAASECITLAEPPHSKNGSRPHIQHRTPSWLFGCGFCLVTVVPLCCFKQHRFAKKFK